jgi:Zn-finger protein
MRRRPAGKGETSVEEQKKKEGAYRFFSNRECEYFPCHQTSRPEEFNCLFCYCPLYALGDQCGGNFTYSKSGNKCCTGCLIPHLPENYDSVVGRYREIVALMRRSGTLPERTEPED